MASFIDEECRAGGHLANLNSKALIIREMNGVVELRGCPLYRLGKGDERHSDRGRKVPDVVWSDGGGGLHDHPVASSRTMHATACFCDRFRARTSADLESFLVIGS